MDIFPLYSTGLHPLWFPPGPLPCLLTKLLKLGNTKAGQGYRWPSLAYGRLVLLPPFLPLLFYSCHTLFAPSSSSSPPYLPRLQSLSPFFLPLHFGTFNSEFFWCHLRLFADFVLRGPKKIKLDCNQAICLTTPLIDALILIAVSCTLGAFTLVFIMMILLR